MNYIKNETSWVNYIYGLQYVYYQQMKHEKRTPEEKGKLKKEKKKKEKSASRETKHEGKASKKNPKKT